MNRNELFQTVSGVTMGRSKFDLSHSAGRSFNEGDLVPFLCTEVLPGDTFDVKANGFVRSITPLYPVMDNAKIDTYFFYVRSRNLWDHWKEFCGENNTSAWKQNTKYSVPGRTIAELAQNTIQYKTGIALNGYSAYSLWSYIGAPPLFKLAWNDNLGDFDYDPLFSGDLESCDVFCSVLPFRAYRQIWNDFFRNQNVQDPVLVSTSDTAGFWEYTDKNSGADFSSSGFLKAGRVADYFSSVLPEPQRGPAVSLPLIGSEVPVTTSSTVQPYDATKATIKFTSNIADVTSSGQKNSMVFTGVGNGVAAADKRFAETGTTPNANWQPGNLVINLEQVDAVSINALRLAFATQRWYEALGRGGGRYFEILRSMWGVYSSDAVMQMPEYLGGSTFALSNRQVLQTSGSSDANSSPLGETGAFSLSTGSAGSFVHSFDEHGYLFGLAVLRVERSYSQGMPAYLQRKSFFSFYTPQLAHIGEQQLPKSEIYLTGGSAPLGYKEAWTEYRYLPNNIKGMMDPALKNGFQAWTYGDVYDGARPFRMVGLKKVWRM